MIMYNLAKECNKIKCYRCGEIIELDEFSIDHKENWLHELDAKHLFFNYENIAFSHNKCNSAARRVRKSFKHGFRGVSLSNDGKRKRKYVASINVDGKTKNLGRFYTPAEAAIAYDNFIQNEGLQAVTNKDLGLL